MLDDQEQEEGDKDKDDGGDARSYVRGVGEMSIEELRAVSLRVFFDAIASWFEGVQAREEGRRREEGRKNRAHRQA